MMERGNRSRRIDRATMLELTALNREVRRRRLEIFRTHLERTIRLASPLLIDAGTPDELDEATWRLKPGAEWPGGQTPRVLVRDWSAESRQRVGKRVTAVNHATGERFFVMDRLELRMGRHTANMLLEIGPLSIHTGHRGGCVFIPQALDERQCAKLVGAPLDRVVALPLVSERPYTIISPPVALNDDTMAVRFEAAPVEWVVPWNRPWELPF